MQRKVFEKIAQAAIVRFSLPPSPPPCGRPVCFCIQTSHDKRNDTWKRDYEFCYKVYHMFHRARVRH